MTDICEIEAMRRVLHVGLVGRWVLDSSDPRGRALRGYRLTAVTRIAKTPVLEFENIPFPTVFIACRLGVGSFSFQSFAGKPHGRWWMSFGPLPGEGAPGHLIYSNATRAFSFDFAEFRHHLTIAQQCGVDPLSDQFTLEHVAWLCSRPMAIHELLMRPELVPGLSIGLASEVLFSARIHPERRATDLTTDERERLAVALVRSILSGVRNCGPAANDLRVAEASFKGRPLDDRSVDRRIGRPCHICSHRVEAVRVGKRRAYFCASCQPRQPRSADAVPRDFVESLAKR